MLVVALALASGLISTTPGAPASPGPTTVAVASGSPPAGASPTTSPLAPVTQAPTSTIEVTASPPRPPSPSTTVGTPPSQAPSSTPTASPSAAPQSRFTPIEGFPPAGEFVTEVSAVGSGFVAVGYVNRSSDECEQYDGRIWSSGDGVHWARQAEESLAGVRMGNVVSVGGTVYAFGHTSSDSCLASDTLGNSTWRSSDGVNWELISAGIGSESAWDDVAMAGETLIAVGAAPFDQEQGGVWTSVDGVTWQAASRPPRTYHVVSVAAQGRTVVAFGEDLADGLAWYSNDAGQTWRRGTMAGGYVGSDFHLAVADGRFVAVTAACCTAPNTWVGMAFSSTDGRTWAASAPAAGQPGRQLALTVPGGFLAVTEAGSTRLSSDGLDWRNGPPGPALHPEFDFLAAAAAGPAGVVTVAYQRVGGESLVRAWFAPISAFDLAAWTEPVPPADPPVIGEAYDYELYTHCGTENIRVPLDGGIWIVERVESVGRGFRNPSDRGTITMLSRDQARYASRRGGMILLQRTQSPPPWPRCA